MNKDTKEERNNNIVYPNSSNPCFLGHYAVVRQDCKLGKNCSIYNNTTLDYGCILGDNVKIHCNCYIAQYTIIEDDVFIAPGVTILNDIHPGCPEGKICMKGPLIKKGARIGGGSVILPKVIIGRQALIGAGSVVTKDVPDNAVVYGNPAKVQGSIFDLKCKTTRRNKPYKK